MFFTFRHEDNLIFIVFCSDLPLPLSHTFVSICRKRSKWAQTWTSRTHSFCTIPSASVSTFFSYTDKLIERLSLPKVHSTLPSQLSASKYFSSTTVMTRAPSQNLIIPLFLLIEAFGPSCSTAAEFLLAWMIGPVFRANDILLSILSGHEILSTELEMVTKSS